MNKGFKYIRILALVISLATILGCMPALAESYSAAVMGKQLAVYTDPGLENQFANLEKRSIVTVKATSGKVAKIEYKGTTLYAPLDGLTPISEIGTPAVSNQNTTVYEAADKESNSTGLKKGVQVYVLNVSGSWATIERNGNLGYANADHFTPVASDDSFGGASGNEDTSISGSDKVVIETIEVVVSEAKLPVYKSASTDSEKLGVLKQGKELTLYARNGDWAYIGLDGSYGFCALSGLRRLSSSESGNPFDDVNSVPATVTENSVTIYKSASTSSSKLGTLKKGAEVNLIQAASGWAYIELNGNYGYCDSDAIAITETMLPEEEDDDTGAAEVIDGKTAKGTCTVITANADLYASKSTSNKIGSLTMGDTVSYYSASSKWVLVGVNGSFAYMQRSKLSADSYTELENEDSGSAVLELEKALLKLGYLDTVPSSNFSSSTVKALERLQEACGMEKSGVADEATLRVIYSGNAPLSLILSASLSSGSSGTNVTRLQTRLHALGYLSSAASIDGDYGAKTASAIRLFQKAAGISETGSANSATIKALYSANAPELPSGATAADVSTGSSSNSSSMDSNLSSSVNEYVSGMSNAKKLEYVIYVAQQQLGKPYVFGSAGTSSFDCSGLTLYCFKQVGVSLQHSAYGEGYNDKYTKISALSALRRGDLVFFNTLSDGDLCDHVGIYLGSSKFIHASSGSAKVVVSDMASGYYNRVFSWGRRILNT